MKIRSVRLQRICLEMKEPFAISYGVETHKDAIIVIVKTENGGVGYGECVASPNPVYGEETNETALHLLRDFYIPTLLPLTFHTVSDLKNIRLRLQHFKGNQMAKAAIEMAIWDAYANETNQPLTNLLGGTRQEIPVGISVGIQPSIKDLIAKVHGYVDQGFKRIKIKVRPGFDFEPLSAVRKEFPDVHMMADANSAYRLKDLEHLQKWDAFNLMMIEQPLAHDDIVDHARLQAKIKTPICLDESIRSAEDLRKAIELDACRVLNLKVGRVGGFGEAILIHEMCVNARMDLWCGGMEETGIGRLHNMALTALPGFTLPGDTAPSARYFEQDIIDPPVTFVRPGILPVDSLAGVASRVRPDRLKKWTVHSLDIVSPVGETK